MVNANMFTVKPVNRGCDLHPLRSGFKPQVELVDGITHHCHRSCAGLARGNHADLLTLATAIVPNRMKSWPNFFKVPLNEDGFFVEKHAKLGPSEFATDGVFLCGMAHYPKPIDEAIVQGRAAASRAVTLLARRTSTPAAKWPK
jgi:heterodisulfide reductase subunit A